MPVGTMCPRITFSLRPTSVVALAADGRLGEHLGRLLEGGRRDERVRGERGLRDAEQQRLARRGLAAVLAQSLVLSGGSGTCRPRPPGRNSESPGSLTCTLRIICDRIVSMCLSSIVTDCERYTFCTSPSRYAWTVLLTVDAEHVLGVQRARRRAARPRAPRRPCGRAGACPGARSARAPRSPRRSRRGRGR